MIIYYKHGGFSEMRTPRTSIICVYESEESPTGLMRLHRDGSVKPTQIWRKERVHLHIRDNGWLRFEVP